LTMMKKKAIPPHLQSLLPKLDQIKIKVDKVHNYVVGEEIHKVREELAKLNPFNLQILDMFSEAEKLKNQPPGPIPAQDKQMIKLKIDFWKEKLGDSAAEFLE